MPEEEPPVAVEQVGGPQNRSERFEELQNGPSNSVYTFVCYLTTLSTAQVT